MRTITGAGPRMNTTPCMNTSHGRKRHRGFTLIELLVVVAIISVLTGILLPVFIKARDNARKRAAQRADEQAASLPTQLQTGRAQKALPRGPAPIFDALDLKMKLLPSYHRIGMDVYTRYQVDCTGNVTFRNPDAVKAGQVLLTIPFPLGIVEARDVQLQVRRDNTAATSADTSDPLLDVTYDKSGIYATCSIGRGEVLIGDLAFTAFGRDQFDYALPPARELRSVAITLDLAGAQARTIPDDSLQPSSETPDQLKWEFKNLVSDRQITVLIPSAQAPLARVLLLSRLVAVAVLLFGAGFWFLSEQVKPGQLDSFRWGHFLLLALTFSLFFVIFAVLEFHGRLATPVSMAVAALFSLPLLLLHVSRVLDTNFAVTRVLPLAIFTLGLVINGVYGGDLRDYIFIGATIFIIAYATVAYQTWAAGRENHRHQQEDALLARRRALTEKITSEIGGQMAALDGAEALGKQYNQSNSREELVMAQARLQSALEAVSVLRKEYDELKRRLNYLPREPGWETDGVYRQLERDAEAFRARLEPQLSHLQTELDRYREETKTQAAPAGSAEKHCMACGHAVPQAPFCQNCGEPQSFAVNCAGCGEHIVIPLHVLADSSLLEELHCPHCGTRLPAIDRTASSEQPDADDQD